MAEKKPVRQPSNASVRGTKLNWPDIQLVEINRRGMVFRSHKLFDLGDSLTLGVHLCARPSANAATQPVSGDFLNVEGIVVDCRILSWGGAEKFYEVTVLFQSLDEDECEILVDASRHQKLDPPAGCEDDAGEAPTEDETGFDRILGLN